MNGNMCVGVHKDSLVVRAGEREAAPLLARAHVRPMDITGKPMKGWVMVEPEGVEDDEQLAGWIERVTKFVKTLPKK